MKKIFKYKVSTKEWGSRKEQIKILKTEKFNNWKKKFNEQNTKDRGKNHWAWGQTIEITQYEQLRKYRLKQNKWTEAQGPLGLQKKI